MSPSRAPAPSSRSRSRAGASSSKTSSRTSSTASSATGGSASGSAERHAHGARERLEPVARVGFAVSGLLHVLIGWLAVQVALGGGSGSADQSGALGAVAATPFGAVLLWAAAAALVALGLWQLLDGVLAARDHEAKDAVSGIGKGVAFLAVAGTAATFAQGGSSSSEGSADDVTATLMGSPGGVLLVGAVGLVVLGIGGYHVYKGFSGKVREDLSGSVDLRVPGSPSSTQVTGAAVWAGRVGFVAKGVALAVVGVLFVVAAVRSDPQEAGGLDSAMRTLLEAPFGVALLVAVGVGFALYGVWSFVRARWGDL